jgi:abortive infection bacteriophage resistance protein
MSRRPAIGTKSPLNLKEQVALLEARGFAVNGQDTELARFLYDNSYYRLSGYWRYFQNAPHRGDNRFIAGATLSNIRDVYAFDATLRNILMEGLCDFEVAVRGRLAYHMSEANDGVDSYLRPSTYLPSTYDNGTEMRVALLDAIRLELRRTKERSVTKYRDSGQAIPVWAAMEVMSFGTVSKMYRLLSDRRVKEIVAKRFGVNESRRLDSTLHSLSILRNACAHHGRIWNRVVTVKPFVMKKLMTDSDRDIYYGTPWSWLIVLADLVDGVRRDMSFSSTLFSHLDDHPEYMDGLKRPQSR